MPYKLVTKDFLKEVLQGRKKLLKMNDEDASGANLTVANHVVFVHPMDVESKHVALACERQALGRVLDLAPLGSMGRTCSNRKAVT